MANAIAERLANEPALRALFATGRRRAVPRHQVVLDEGSPPESLYLLMSGTLAVMTRGKGDEDLLLAYVHPGDFFGEMGLFPDIVQRSARVQARSDCMVLEIGYVPFLELTQKYPSLWLELASQIAARLRDVNRRLAEMPTLHAADRIWLVLQDLARRSDAPEVIDGKRLRITRHDLGKLAGCTRELAGMVLRDLQTDGRVRLEGQSVIVLTCSLRPEAPLASLQAPVAMAAPAAGLMPRGDFSSTKVRT